MSEQTLGEGAPSLARASGALLAARVVGAAGFFVAAVIMARSLGPTGRAPGTRNRNAATRPIAAAPETATKPAFVPRMRALSEGRRAAK